jgi:hypothetical protein
LGPGAGVDVERVEDLLLEAGAAGDGLDGGLSGGEGDPPDAVELVERSWGGEVLGVDVGIADIVLVEGVAEQGLDHRGEDADGDVPADAGLGPVEDRSEAEEVLQDPEAVLDQLP